jgi:hypothetical protein
MASLNWAKANADARTRQRGSESINGAPAGRRPSSRSASAPPSPKLAAPVTVAEWWKNRRKESIRIRLSVYEDRPLIDIRTWFGGDDGVLKPGKGFAASIKHLPRLAAEITKALAKARELGLLVDEEASDD